jgi:hypothetical protein
MNKPTILATLMLLLVISGCATTTKYPKIFDYKNSQNGIVYGTVTYEGEYSGYRVYYKGEGENKGGWVQTGEGSTWTLPFPESFLHRYGIEGDVFAVELAPGKYTFFYWAVASGLYRFGATSHFDIEIEVLPQTLSYVGNFNFVQTMSKGWAVTMADVNYSDLFDRDTKYLLQKYSNFEGIAISKQIQDGYIVKNLGENY